MFVHRTNTIADVGTEGKQKRGTRKGGEMGMLVVKMVAREEGGKRNAHRNLRGINEGCARALPLAGPREELVDKTH